METDKDITTETAAIAYIRRALQMAKRSLEAWEETAVQNQKNADYYRDLVVQIGEMFGDAAKTQDDGNIVPDVLCAKVPEVVKARLDLLVGAVRFTQDFLRKLEAGCPAPDPLYELRRQFHAPLHEKLDAALKGFC